MYDRQEVFKKQIQKKAEELNDICKSLGIVSFMSFCIKDDGEKTTYQNYMHGSVSNGIRLTEDQIRGHINVANGFATIPPDNGADIDDYMNDIED